MNRRSHGVNLDDGVALFTDEDFRLLFVDGRPDTRSALQGWLADDEQGAILFGGQIGMGKTTLLNEVLRAYLEAPVIRMRFDTDCIDATEGGYVLMLFGQVLGACLKYDVETDGCGVALEDFATLGKSDWPGIAEVLTKQPASMATANKLRDCAVLTTPNGALVRRASGQLLNRLAEHLKRQPILVADGVDKFDPTTADYFSLKDTLAFLATQKTLFEVNAIHLFREQDFRIGVRKLLIGSMDDATLFTIFTKRLGSYAPLYHQAFVLLAKYSGGNIRQGLRLLNAYYFQRTQKRKDHISALALACHSVSRDLLSVPFGNFPIDVFSVVKKDGYIEGSLLTEQLTAAGANEAVYRNWLFLDSVPSDADSTQWPARVNPLITMAIACAPGTPTSPEELAVKNWAFQSQLSPMGLNVPLDDYGNTNWDIFWDEIRASLASEDNSLCILQLLEEIGAGLFGIYRRDRIIVTYKTRGNLEAVRDFLVGKANTYAFFPCEEIILIGGNDQQPVLELITRLAPRDPNRIYSIDLKGEWTDTQLRDLEHRRDLFDNLQMVWWIQQDALTRYLTFWQQLRQLFRVYRLEDELWRGITTEQIQSDINVIQSISPESDTEGTHRLQSVLSYLSENRGQP